MAYLINRYIAAEKLGGGTVIGRLVTAEPFVVEDCSGTQHVCKCFYHELMY